MVALIKALAIVPGRAEGIALVSDEPLSFWGGYDHQTGEITDRRHPLSGANAAGRVLAVPFSRGSSTTTAVLLEAIRSGTAPSAILTRRSDSFFALASIVAKEMYDVTLPILVIPPDHWQSIETGDHLTIDARSEIIIDKPIEPD